MAVVGANDAVVAGVASRIVKRTVGVSAALFTNVSDAHRGASAAIAVFPTRHAGAALANSIRTMIVFGAYNTYTGRAARFVASEQSPGGRTIAIVVTNVVAIVLNASCGSRPQSARAEIVSLAGNTTGFHGSAAGGKHQNIKRAAKGPRITAFLKPAGPFGAWFKTQRVVHAVLPSFAFEISGAAS